VDVVSNSNSEIIGNKIVFGSWVGLDDVSPLSSDVKVVNSGICGDARWSGHDGEGLRSVLEGSGKLGSVDGKLSSEVSVERGVKGVGTRGWSNVVQAVSGVVHQQGGRVGSVVNIESDLSGGDVVSKSKNTVVVV